MSNELLNTYIKFGEPDGDDLDFSQIADWAGYLLQEQRERITELEQELLEERASYEAERQRLLAKIADWQDRFTEGLMYDEDNNQTVLVWTQREIDQAKSEADELCRKLGIPLDGNDELG